MNRNVLIGEEFFVRGEYGEALRFFKSVLDVDPQNTRALNDAGLVYAELGEVEKAVEYFEKALQYDPSFAKAFFNLLDTLIKYNHLDLAAEVYLKYHVNIDDEEKVKYEKILGNVIYEILSIKLKLEETVDLGKPKTAENPIKVAFICGSNTSFIIDLEIAFSARYHVRAYHFSEKVDFRLIQDALDWADVVWFEWADAILAQASNTLRKTAAVICRVHRYEVFTNWFENINWNFVDHLIVTSKHVYDLIKEKVDLSKFDFLDVSIIPSIINIDKFDFHVKEKGYNIAYLGYLNYRKNPSLLIQCIKALVELDKKYKLYIGGIKQNEEIDQYLTNIIDKLDLKDNVIWCGWIENVSDWLKDKHYLILPSIHEGNPYCVLEAAACGVKPLVHYFPGSDELYPNSWLFKTVNEFVDKVINDTYDSFAYRRYAEEKYSFDIYAEKLFSIIETLSKRWNEFKSSLDIKRINSKSVCIVASDFVGIVKNGGIGTAYTELAELLAQNDWQVTVLYVGHRVDNSTYKWIEYYRKNNIQVIPLSALLNNCSLKSSSLSRALSFEIYQWLKKYQECFDVIHFHEWQGLAFYSMLAKEQGLAFKNCKIVVGVHSPHLWTLHYNLKFPGIRDLEIDFMEKESVKRADYVWFINNYMKNWIEKQWNIHVSNYIIKPYPLFLDAIGVDTEQKNKCNKLNLIFFGRLEFRKGLDIFCQALNLIKNTEVAHCIDQIFFLGKDVKIEGKNSKKYIQEKSKGWPWKNNILSNFDRNEALEFIKNCNNAIIVMPYRMDNSPLSVYECLALKKRFLVTNVGGIPELIHPDDHAYCLFEPNAAALAHALSEALTKLPPIPRPAIDQKENRKSWVAWHNALVRAERRAPNLKNLEDRNPLVSVCLVHYNRPHFLEQAINSLLNQTYHKYEVILVDDGSDKPEALQFLEDIKDLFEERKWKILKQKNKYVSAARNWGAKHAAGEYVMFMDDDNLAKDFEIETFVTAALNSNADILTCVADNFKTEEDFVLNLPVARYIPLGGFLELGCIENVFGDANMLVKLKVFHELGGFNELRNFAFQDWEFLIRACLNGYKISVVPEPLFWYRIHGENISRGYNNYNNHLLKLEPYLQKPILDVYKKLFFVLNSIHNVD
ncbi:glycosyltransferase [Rhodothermus bifroesti]|uniref:Glycosyltransferase n=1 Tax=Rhodothermus marinus TaxID=29549 RepID=A0A7V2AYW1_RHOMR|nr:glycosyltransferase [Rhodothermus bifroesti]GBD00755.1 putative glycosyltransferase EpsJ [bacterium HR18]